MGTNIQSYMIYNHHTGCIIATAVAAVTPDTLAKVWDKFGCYGQMPCMERGTHCAFVKIVCFVCKALYSGIKFPASFLVLLISVLLLSVIFFFLHLFVCFVFCSLIIIKKF